MTTLAEAPDTGAKPISGRARIQSIDTLRGVALFGILLMNIIAFANPFAAYLDPRVDGADSGLDLGVFMTMDILVEGSMRALFSMLFGAGMLIFLHKPGAEPQQIKALYYRRTLWLIGFGLFDAYLLLWSGDILYAYGVTGLLLFFFRNFSARRLALCSVAFFLLLALLHGGMHYQGRMLTAAVAEVQALPPGTELSNEQTELLQTWDNYLEQQFMTPDAIAEELATKRGGLLENFLAVAEANLFIQTFGFVINAFWDALAMMLLGMALLKWGWLDASRSLRAYVLLCAIGFGIGIPVNTWETLNYVNSGFQIYWNAFARPTYDLGRLSMALGYIGLVMVVCKLELLTWLRQGLARVGQMALSNYLTHSLICNLVFMGFGLGLAGELARHEIYYVVLVIWVFQFWFSSWWLQRFRFGPAEWLWRSLTYRQRQPLLLS